ncbi:hypothetical protein DMA12_35015 [Amycolatopsis balhimycina DSM 5908]|uniref:Uncharacterized protein n=1 Tax=Amycolatopsis balhimycina DSM 5908 TaxID=1081091 RepID=A0A428W4Q7_AMYBA|nr:hypothetical protein [Amycolatopsis balhimycina]RSM37954.1 hypothetical protein DMA12_35015 [Amycolatopsis balhimycina DSM 5908]
MLNEQHGQGGRRFTASGLIAALPRPGGSVGSPLPWGDLVRAVPWLLIVFIGMIAKWSVTEITGLLGLLVGCSALPGGGATDTSGLRG